jgi:thiol-disulfide isomerase/thioredoxin
LTYLNKRLTQKFESTFFKLKLFNLKQLIIILVLVFNLANSKAQNNFVISGTTDFISNGRAILSKTVYKEEYCPIDIKKDTVDIRNHLFEFEGLTKHPLQFRITLMDNNNEIITEPFFIDRGFQKIIIDSNAKVNSKFDFGYGVSMIGSETNSEYLEKYLPLFDSINKRIEIYFAASESCDSLNNQASILECEMLMNKELNTIRNIRDIILLNYVIQNPSSAINPWLLYESLRKYGYKDIYQKTFDLISESTISDIKNYLNLFIFEQKSKSVGRVFPLLDFINSQSPFQNSTKNKFTLVEFWYSGCIPCIAQFQILRKVYEEYNKKGFNIIAISTDSKKTMPSYVKILKSKNYPWTQLLDLDGKRAVSINIQRYPTSFLLDENGKIVLVDVNPSILSDFLSKSLYTK